MLKDPQNELKEIRNQLDYINNQVKDISVHLLAYMNSVRKAVKHQNSSFLDVQE